MHNDEQLAAKYQKITDDNLHRRGHEFDDIGAHLASELYSDRTHFIYELLQNAEDALARRSASQPCSLFPHSVDFRLFPDRLEMCHFGQPFDDRDIASISDVFKSTKRDDLTQIGKKGIGFKSVYAFTHLPEVYSGSERFQIERFIRLKLAAPRPLVDGQTLFVLPLSGDEQERQEKFRQIRERLKNLDLRPLLFLRHIHNITWGIEDESSGCYQYTYEDEGWARRVTVVTQRSESTVPTAWLVFQRPVKLVESCSALTVEIAFQLDTPSKDGVQDIVPVPESESQLLVYFPTKHATYCGFLIQGPFKTIANREDIHQSDDWNRCLIEEVAELVIDTLHKLRDRGMLTVGVLKTMPLKTSSFQKGSIFQPIYERVREALREQPLLPTDDGGFVPGKYAKLARGEQLLDLMSPLQLRLWLATSSRFYGKPEYKEELKERRLWPIETSPYNWLDRRITEAQTRDLHEYLVGRESRWLPVESLVSNIEVRPEIVIRQLTLDFLESQTDEWLTNFYKFMLEHKDLWEVVKYRSIIRLEPTSLTDKPNHVAPFRKEGGVDIPNAYLPGEVDSDLPLVKKTLLADDKSKRFLVELGLTEPNLVAEVLQEVLPKYASQAPILSEEEHRQDLKKIFAALHTDSQVERKRVLDRLRETAFLRAVNAVTKESAFRIPGTLYVRSPELTCYFEGNRDAWFLDENEAIEDIRTALGIAHTVRVKRRESDAYGDVHLETFRRYHKRGVDRFDPSIHIDGLEYALTHKPSREKAAFIWNRLLLPNSDCLCGTIESCSRQTFVGAKREYQWSEIGVLVTEQAWLPHPNDGFSKPQALSLDDLPSEFSKHETVAKLLGMRSSSMTTLAQGLGIAPAVIEFFQQNKDALRDFEEFKKWREDRRKPKKPEHEPRSQERRRQQVAQAAKDAPPVISEVRPRQERSNWEEQHEARVYLRVEYTNEDKELICQICGEEMPFKLDAGAYYFEAIECVRGTGKELLWNHLALCPVCAAKYRHAHSIQPEEIKRRVLAALTTEVPITLAREEKTIWFTKVHLLDLQTALPEV